MSTRTRREQDIEQVAGIIIENGLLDRPERSPLITAINSNQGWGFDVRYDDGEYIRDTQWTRVEGLQLSARDLEKAIALARDFRREATR